MDCWQRNEGKAEPKRRVGAPEGNQGPMTHGIFANKCLDKKERVLFQEVIDWLYTDFEFNRSSDFIQIEFIAINTLKYTRAIAEGNMDAAQKFDAMIRANMKDVKMTKSSRESEQPTGPKTTPAEWAADLLQKSHNESAADKPRRASRRENARRVNKKN